VERVPLKIGDRDPLPGENRHIAIGEEEHVACVVENRRYVGGKEVLAVSHAHHDRRTGPCGDDFIGLHPRNHRDREDPGDLTQCGPYGGHHVAHEVLFDQVGDDLGVGFGLEDMPFGLELLFQPEVVFNNAVVHHHEVALAVAVRMRILFVGAAVSGPACVTDPGRPCHGRRFQCAHQVPQFAFGSSEVQFVIIAALRPGRVIAPIFQPRQSHPK
jgi:hypothetical protein